MPRQRGTGAGVTTTPAATTSGCKTTAAAGTTNHHEPKPRPRNDRGWTTPRTRNDRGWTKTTEAGTESVMPAGSTCRTVTAPAEKKTG